MGGLKKPYPSKHDLQTTSNKQPQSVLNTFEYRETQNSKTLKANFSDAVGNSLNETLNNFLGNRFLPVGIRKPVVKERELEPLMQLPSGDLSISDDVPIKKSPSEPIVVSNMFEKIFRLQDQELILLEPRIKAKTKLEYSKKLTILVIYYFNSVQNKPIDKTQLKNFMKKMKLFNNHLQSWLAKTPEINNSNNGLELSIPAQEQVLVILREIFDTSIQEGWMPGGKSRTSSTKKTGEKSNGKEIIDIPADSAKKKTGYTGKLTPAQTINKLIEQGYFSEKRTISNIIEYCSSQLAQTRKANELSSTLIRFIRDGKLKREKNSDQQYEYHV